MDKNTVIGLVLIGLLLTVYTIFNQPTEAELKKQQAELVESKKNSAANKVTKKKNTLNNSKNQSSKFVERKNGTSVPTNDDGKLIRLENEKLIIDFSTKGGQVAAVYLKEFENYSEYAKKTKQEKKQNRSLKLKPLNLFRDGDAVNELQFSLNGKQVKTSRYLFEVISQSKNEIVFSLDLGEGKSIEQHYRFKKNAYDIDYSIQLSGMGNSVQAQNIRFNWETAFRKTERLISEQRRVSTVCFYNKEEGIDYLSEMGNDDAVAESTMDWISYKQSYFSSILKPQNGFNKDGTEFKTITYEGQHPRMWTHLKDFKSFSNLNFSNAENARVDMNWYFGPNDYQTLRSYQSHYEDILNFGWGLFRWINEYAFQPLFTFLTNNGIGVGMAIFWMTIILKFILMPIQWKMFTSSVKMRILKPEIDELNAKYPDKEDAMKKQMEMMTLYRESGASPLAGCIPMLIQMPILMAVFRFFPAAFELRQQPFLWAEDLSSYDSIWDFGVNIWFYGDHMSLFTLLMAATTILYTYMNSGNMQQPQQPGMPNMKVIMYIFPVLMIFIFNNYASGLTYYYFFSTLISILSMVIIKQFFVDEEKLKAKMATKKAAAQASGKTKKKSKLQERLEMMQKMQQEQMKNRKK